MRSNGPYLVLPPGERPPAVLADLAGGGPAELLWRNELGGQTWRVGGTVLKWSPDAAGIDLGREVERLRWLEGRHPAPRVLDEGRSDGGAWFTTERIDAASAVEEQWRARPAARVRATAEGLRRVHALPVVEVPVGWTSWATRSPTALGPRPSLDDPVVVHGDACAPNTLLDARGAFVANVDAGDVAVGDRWADLAVASMSLGWNYGEGWEPLFYDAYGIAPDPARIAWYRALWDLES